MKSEATQTAAKPAVAEIPVHDAEELTQGTGRALIRFGGETWVLSITRAGRLILTK